MTDFIAFARAHGILMSSIPPLGVWRRFPTESKPHHRNGAVKWMGDHAFVCDWAAGAEVHVWKSDAEVKIDHDKIRRLAREAEAKRIRQQEEAAKKAQWILSQTNYARHPYLASKGFTDEQGSVWVNEGQNILVIPMRIGHRIVGCQLIDEAGGKKFLWGQRTSNAEYVMDAKGPHILCEGYATALSIKQALTALKRKFTLHVCFSAGNLVKVASTLPMGYVIADHDASGTGERAARETGWPWWMPPEIGDFNDFSQQVKTFKASQALNKLFMRSL